MVEAIVGGRTPQDTTGDGLYNDITGDGLFNVYDVEVFSDNLDHPAVQNNPEKFNFAGGGRLGSFDVQVLFGMLDEHGTGVPSDNPAEFVQSFAVDGSWAGTDAVSLSVEVATDDVYTPNGTFDVPVVISLPGGDNMEFIQPTATGGSDVHEYEIDVSAVDQQTMEIGVSVAGSDVSTITLDRTNEPDGEGTNSLHLAAAAGLALAVLRRVGWS